jgi:hypothetical protein
MNSKPYREVSMKIDRAVQRKLIVGGVSFTIALITLGAVAVLIFAGKAQQELPAAAEVPQKELQSEVVSRRDLGVWGYGASRDEAEGLWISINYDHDTVNDLMNYVAANKALIPAVEAVGGRVDVAITFAQPMQPEKFREWAKLNGLQVKQAQLPAGGSTMGIMGTADDPLPQASIDKFPYAGLSGVFGAYATVEARRLSTIASDPQVFLLDVTPAWTRRDLAQSGIAEALESDTDVYVDLAWGWMEMLRMVPTPTGVPAPVGTVVAPTLPPGP